MWLACCRLWLAWCRLWLAWCRLWLAYWRVVTKLATCGSTIRARVLTCGSTNLPLCRLDGSCNNTCYNIAGKVITQYSANLRMHYVDRHLINIHTLESAQLTK